MANPSTDDNDREDSGLQDILAVAATLKETPSLDDAAGDVGGEDSGMILFTAGDLSGGDSSSDDNDALFGSFAGGLGAGFGSAIEPSGADLEPQGGLGGLGSVAETTAPEVRATPAEEPSRNPLTVLAVVLGLGLVAAGAVFLTQKDEPAKPQQQAGAEMSANNGDAAVGKIDEPDSGAAAGASGGAIEPEPTPEPVAEPAGETEGAAGAGAEAGAEAGEGAEGLLAAADTSDEDDPMAQKKNLLGGGTSQVAKAGKWDEGEPADSGGSPTPKPSPEPSPEPEPEPEPVAKPEPAPKPAGGGGHDDEVDCLLNPDLPKCNTGGASKPKHDEILAPKLPDKLDSTALRNGFNTVKSKAKACGSKHGAEAGTKVKIHASIEGASGKITSVSAQGEHAGTDLGKCVEDAVKDATFEPFKKPSQGVDYSMIM